MGVRIVAGCARNLELAAPPGTAVRPTAIRARKAAQRGGFEKRICLEKVWDASDSPEAGA